MCNWQKRCWCHWILFAHFIQHSFCLQYQSQTKTRHFEFLTLIMSKTQTDVPTNASHLKACSRKALTLLLRCSQCAFNACHLICYLLQSIFSKQNHFSLWVLLWHHTCLHTHIHVHIFIGLLNKPFISTFDTKKVVSFQKIDYLMLSLPTKALVLKSSTCYKLLDSMKFDVEVSSTINVSSTQS